MPKGKYKPDILTEERSFFFFFIFLKTLVSDVPAQQEVPTMTACYAWARRLFLNTIDRQGFACLLSLSSG